MLLQVLVIAVLMKLILRRTFTVCQWEALLLLSVGITINQLDHCMCVPQQQALFALPLIFSAILQIDSRMVPSLFDLHESKYAENMHIRK